MPRSIATPPWTGYQSIKGLPPGSMSLVPIYTLGCLRKHRNGRSLNPGPQDPEFEVLTAKPHMPPYGYGKLGKHPGFVSYSYLKDSEFPTVKRDALL